MHSVTRETMFGGHRGDAVMIVAIDDSSEVGADEAMCEICSPIGKYPREHAPSSRSALSITGTGPVRRSEAKTP